MFKISRLNILQLLFLMLINTSYVANASDIVGYKDLLFGMTEEEAIQTNIVNNGIVLFGRNSNVKYKLNKSKKISTIYVEIGEYDKSIHEKIIEVLNKKYRPSYKASESDFNRYSEKEEMSDQRFFSLTMLASLFDTMEDNSIKNLAWMYDKAQVTFVIGKILDFQKSNKYNILFKDVMYVIYQDKNDSISYFNNFFEKQSKINKKTTEDDL